MTRIAWRALLVASGVIALVAAAHWTLALVAGRPVIYGEGAVANAAILLREGNPYRDASGMVAANYPPLYLWLASFADPLRAGRAVTILSALTVAAIVWWRAGVLDRVPRAALALTWLALMPVATWGAAVKPDMLAVALTLAGVAVLERALRSASLAPSRAASGPLLGGALLALAVWAKPTALLPAVAVLLFLAFAGRPIFVRAAVGASVVAAIALAHAATFGLGDVWRHVVVWNALRWTAEQAALPLLVGAATLGILIAAAARLAAFRGVALAYVLGAVAIAVLGGREGASINYLLDLAAATCFAIAATGPRLVSSRWFPAAAAAQVVIGFLVIAPFGLIPGREPGTGRWGSAERAAVIASLDPGRAHLVEDSGLLVAAGITPVVDDLFLWSRLAERGTIDPAPLLGRVRSGEIATVVSEVDLTRLADAPEYERSRWHPELVEAILEKYTPLVSECPRPRMCVYRPR